MRPVLSGDQPKNRAPASPSTMLFPVARSITCSDWSCVYARCEPSGEKETALTWPPLGNGFVLTGPLSPCVYTASATVHSTPCFPQPTTDGAPLTVTSDVTTSDLRSRISILPPRT